MQPGSSNDHAANQRSSDAAAAMQPGNSNIRKLFPPAPAAQIISDTLDVLQMFRCFGPQPHLEKMGNAIMRCRLLDSSRGEFVGPPPGLDAPADGQDSILIGPPPGLPAPKKTATHKPNQQRERRRAELAEEAAAAKQMQQQCIEEHLLWLQQQQELAAAMQCTAQPWPEQQYIAAAAAHYTAPPWPEQLQQEAQEWQQAEAQWLLLQQQQWFLEELRGCCKQA
jgi:hypothetical protein